jgi:hypothetical protein
MRGRGGGEEEEVKKPGEGGVGGGCEGVEKKN